MKAEEKEALPKDFDEYYKKYFLQNNEDQATKIWNDIICHLQTGLDVADELLSAQSREIEELKQSIRASERFRITDAASAITEANELREKIKEQELIIYGIEEGSGQWQSLCADKEREITDLKAEIEELKTDLKIATSNDEELLMAINKLREQGF